MIKIQDVKPGQTYTTTWGGEYKMLRACGEIQQMNRNQWGRAEGGTHTELKFAVKANRLHKGWWFMYVSYHPSTMVTIKD